MAKISAHGDREAKRYRREQRPDRLPASAAAATLVVTERGRVLRKYDGASGYNKLDVTLPVADRARMIAAADIVAGAMGYEAV